jgi:hypothetical protein
MTLLVQRNFSATAVSARFNLTLQRKLSESANSSRWIVRPASSSVPVRDKSAPVEQLFELLLMPSTGDDAEKLAFTEVLADEYEGDGHLVDMLIDHEHGFAWLFSYEASLPLREVSRQSLLTAGQLASVLIAIVALGSRARNAGYCISGPDADALHVSSSAALSLKSATGFHAAAPASRDCCARGFDTSALMTLFAEVGEPVALEILRDIIQALDEASLDENALEVCLHLIREVLTPQEILLPSGIDRHELLAGRNSLSTDTDPTSSFTEVNGAKTPRFLRMTQRSRFFGLTAWVRNSR